MLSLTNFLIIYKQLHQIIIVQINPLKLTDLIINIFGRHKKAL